MGRNETPSPRLAAYGMLEMGIGVLLWFRSDGPLSESQVVHYYADMALRLVSSGHHVLAQYHVSCYEGQSRELT